MYRSPLNLHGGQYWTRTSDPRRVKAVLYQLSQLPGKNPLKDGRGVVNKKMLKFQFQANHLKPNLWPNLVPPETGADSGRPGLAP